MNEDQPTTEEALPDDSRELISDIFYSNKSEITKKIGFTFITGKTLYSVGKISDLQDQYIFENHSKFSMTLELKNKCLSFKTFIPGD